MNKARDELQLLSSSFVIDARNVFKEYDTELTILKALNDNDNNALFVEIPLMDTEKQATTNESSNDTSGEQSDDDVVIISN